MHRYIVFAYDYDLNEIGMIGLRAPDHESARQLPLDLNTDVFAAIAWTPDQLRRMADTLEELDDDRLPATVEEIEQLMGSDAGLPTLC